MLLGLCTNAAANARTIATSTVDYVEENVQSFLAPRDGDEAAWRARLAAALAGGRPILAACCFLPGDLPCVGPAVDRAAIRAWATVAFRRAAQAGMRTVVFGSGGSRRIPEGFDRAEARRQFVDLLRELGPLAQRHGVQIAVEPLNPGECNFITSVTEGAAVVREAATPGVRLLADLYHMLRAGEGPEALRACAGLLVHVHVAEREKRTAPGVAGDDFRPFLHELAAIGYEGPVSIESGWDDLAAGLDKALAALRLQLADTRLAVAG
ncbi:MAG: sugar phosphate isomerase/epimerase [Planctomycetes bacterium]|nr:sugar phosphate isomerase/epimerase [Planctomycetota bacterium]